MDLSNGLISGVQTAARLTPRQMMIIAERRLTGSSPVRPELGPEYATAILWAEAALGKALPPPQGGDREVPQQSEAGAQQQLDIPGR